MPFNPDLHLNPKIFDKSVERASMRKGFGEGLVLAGSHDKRVVGLCADLTESLQMEGFKKKFPERFFNVGVAEQNLVTVASGMASMGKIPFVGSYAVFSPGRNWEQIRTTICYNNVPVKIVGSHVGVTVGPDGGSHQALEDIALMRVLPRMVVISPCDALEAHKAVLAMAKTSDPAYIRLSRDKTPIITSELSPFEISKAQRVFESDAVHFREDSIRKTKSPYKTFDVAIIATGHLLFNALKVAKKMEEDGKRVVVLNISTIKPLDEHEIIKVAQEAGAVVTIEEHQVAGGLGSAVAECLAKNFPVPIEFIGVRDEFGQSGTSDELIKHYRLDEKSIEQAVHKVILRK